MLDQNTDRMWYVIGALVVGAGIILLANGTLPDIFASVANAFDEVAGDGVEVVENMEPNYKQNMLLGVSWRNGILYGDQDGYPDTVRESMDGYHWYTVEHVLTKGASSVTLELFEPIPSVGGSYGRVNAYDGGKNYIGTVADNITNINPYKLVVDLPEEAEYIRILLLHGDKGAYSITLNE